MTLLWVFIAASVGFALGFLVCAMCTVSAPTPEPPRRDAS